MKKCIVSLFLLLMIGNMAFAASATFKRLWLEHGAIYNGCTGMKVHASFDINGSRGKKCIAAIYFQSPRGTFVMDSNRQYCDLDGKVCASYDFTPGYDNTSFSDLWVFIPNDEIHMRPGTNTYYVAMYLYDQNVSCIAVSDFLSFSGTGSGAVSNNNGGNNMMNSWNQMQQAMMSGNSAAFDQAYNNAMQGVTNMNMQNMNVLNGVMQGFQNLSQDPEFIKSLGQSAPISGMGGNYDYNNSAGASSGSVGDRLVGTFQAFGISDGITGGSVTHNSSFPVYQYSSGGYYVKSGWKMSTLTSNGKSSHSGYSVSQYNYFAVIDGIVWYFRIY